MLKDSAGCAVPRVNVDGFHKQTQLEMEWMACDAQLRNFAAWRDRLVVPGQDADAKYREIRAHRDQLMADLRKLMPGAARPSAVPPAFPSNRGPLHSRRITAARFLPDVAFPWFGYSGTVQLGQATEFRNWSSPGCKGTIFTDALEETGAIVFGANLAGGPVEGHPVNPGEYDPTKPQLWVHEWYYLIPFPAPVVDSTFTYAFNVNVQAAVLLAVGPAALYSRVWAGDTPNFTGTWVVASGATTLWPIEGFELMSSTAFVRGRAQVQRSFKVRAGQTPAVLLSVNIAAVLLEELTDVVLDELDSFIRPISTTGVGDGLVHFHYEPELVAHQ